MIERRLLRQLEKAAGRFRHLRFVLAWTGVWVCGALAAAAVLGLNRASGVYLPAAATWILVAAVIALFLFGYRALTSTRNYRWVAAQVEAAYPELQTCLLAAVDQQPQLADGRYGYLQASVIDQALHHAYAYTWRRTVPGSRLATAHVAHLVALAAFGVAIASLNLQARPSAAIAEHALQLNEQSTGGKLQVTVEPGTTEIERGTNLLVMAHFQGGVPLHATLVSVAGDEQLQLPMSKRLEDPVFGGRIPEVNQPLTYRVEFADQVSETYQVTVFEYPALVRANAELTFPEYTTMEQRTVQDVRRISAVEGTKLRLLCYLNKNVAEAKLTGLGDETQALTLADAAESLYAAEWNLVKSQRYQLHLTDAEGRHNKTPPTFVVNVLPNKPPNLKLVQPSRDTQVSPIEELQLKANVWDDYGVARVGLTYSLGADDATDVVLGEGTPGKQRTDFLHLVAFENLHAEPDQLLSYHFWAEDAGPAGEVRRVASDMFFAEVRHFEEIFRQGQQPPSGQQPSQPQSGTAQAVEQLAELQKQIVAGTWNVIRRETHATPTPAFDADVGLLAESQGTAIAQATELAQQLEDPQSAGFMQQVLEHMQRAVDTLTAARSDSDRDQLRPALSAEQAAYQALLKLRAREHQVVRSSQSPSSASSSGSPANRAQQQLQQLELNSEENRYETERTAQAQEEQAARENRQVLNRLKELARRQNDLNERLKEMQSALQEAQTDEEREEIQRQLKRLQEEQQQLLRDTEELQERMEQPQNQEQMSEARERLEQTRDNVRQASEALEEGRVSRALAAGTRAQQELDELQDEFRRRAAGQFDEALREMRETARELDETQQRVGQELNELAQPQPAGNSLRDSGQREKLAEEMQGQTEQLKKLLDQVQETVFDAEETEPLLADQLYDTVRDAQQQELDADLNTARRMLEYGFLEDARQVEEPAREGIRNLRQGIEKAAESVLGDETEALNRARDELQELSRQLNEELQRETGETGENSESSGQNPEGQASPAASAAPPSPEQQADPSKRGGPQQPSENQKSQQPGEGQSPDGNQQPNQGQPSDQGQPASPGQPANQDASNANSDQPSNDSPPQPSNGQQPQNGQQPANGQQPQNGQQPNQANRSGNPTGGTGGFERLLQQTTGGPHFYAPISGEDFVEWSDRLRDVEEMIDDPELRAEAARIRDRARGFRGELKRHSQEPNWDLVELQVAKPLAELRDRVAEELLKRTGDKALVPLDRDPVPTRFSEQVRRYYEQLGSGR